MKTQAGRWCAVIAAGIVAALAGAAVASADGEVGLVIQEGGEATTYCIAYTGDGITGEELLERAGLTVQDIDLRLEQLATDRRNRRNREPDPRAPVGNCVACRAPFQVDARFCWQCGTQLIPTLPDPPQGVDLDEQSTQTIERPTT